MSRRTLFLTLGDPNGVGPEITVRLLAALPAPDYPLVIIGPRQPLATYAERFTHGPFWSDIATLDDIATLQPGLHLYCPPELDGFIPEIGEAVPGGGFAAGISLAAAMPGLLSGMVAGVVTCPLNKAMLNAAGFTFPGHTEFFAQKAGLRPDEVCMHLCGPVLRVSLVTTHPRLADVPRLITFDRVLRCLRQTAAFVRRLGRDDKPVAVCGLNPHAGESGLIGDEEIHVIEPAIRSAQREGLNVAGPFPGDTVFHFAAKGDYSAVLAMYHDQGLAPLKLMHFSQAVNVTLGLPFVRTSVDHGTAYGLAGRATADTSSLAEAIRLAELLTQ